MSGDGEAKFWLEPGLQLARNYRYTRQQLKEIESLIEDHYNELVRAWKHHFGSRGDKHIQAWRLAVGTRPGTVHAGGVSMV
ncbi:DUF4160 domain-containing protein [Nitrosococcus watsonii]|uniref:DUF4160 domain-containing protein n=1 Tax=Nitrosococcus watsonii TaxID=473531 RepID=UPI001E540F6B|nr:DUF4160 domain-containing protein [Nitrosococcus watsonii]